MSTAPKKSQPLRIGYCLSLTGPVADNSRSARLAHEIWRDGINRRGGLLGRPVELICHDDEADPSLVPGLYERLMDEDKVDLVMGGYGTGSLAPAMPVISARKRFFVGLMGLGVNNGIGYPGYFAMIPTGPNPDRALTEGFFELASTQHPRPTTVALIAADAEFSRNPVTGARHNAATHGFDVIFERNYPLSTTDFAPLLEDIASVAPDLLFICSYLSDSIALVRAINEWDYAPKMIGASMIGPQSASVKTILGPLLNGIVNYEYWLPVSKMMFEGVKDLMEEYQSRAASAGVDPLGYYMAPQAFAQLQVLEQAVTATSSLDDATLVDYTRKASFRTVVGNVKFGRNGEWTHPRVVQVQFQNIGSHDLGEFKRPGRQVVVAPDEFASGDLIYPYALARQSS
ncbi:MAG: branched-chain amino acid ABC transporter substrate-binding protein [Verrucomicrobiaceae bacterium]|nr:MAG: branched-chain amino acid ABC transporter substrate-binding protein [Verrucomicrobiaceae bacterium]